MDDADMAERRHWHLERSVSLTHIVSTIMLLLAVVGGYSNMSSRLAVLENQQTHFNSQIVQLLSNQAKIDSRQDTEIIELKQIIREDYREILQKLEQMRLDI